ncbi:MAG: phenylalanine--tRNA ligase subunit beta [Planctomycetes bacterium]|nr:phenylalanine--tRNA ligase subunit beta [Planctomycetota bacterium]
MKFTYNWLHDYCKCDLTPEALANALSMRGVAVEDFHNAGDDTCFVLEITANRPDLLSITGVAREVALLTGSQLALPKSDFSRAGADKPFPVIVEDKNLCPRYTGQAIKNVKVAPSPDWLKKRLEAIGLRPVNNIVDITNYILYETGQPLHAFDMDKLIGQKIIVRPAKKDEKIIAIDGKTYSLTPDMLVIADEKRPVAIAGVMGGLETEVSMSTKNILLESACFDLVSIRRTSRKLALSSDSSYRFERGVTYESVQTGSERATALITELAGGAPSGELVDVNCISREKHTIKFRPARAKKVLGIDLPADHLRKILTGLGFAIVHETPVFYELEAPCFRPDCRDEIDIIEEAARIYGYENIPVSVTLPMAIAIENKSDRVDEITRSVLSGAGYDEVMTNSFIQPAMQKDFDFWSKDGPVNALEGQTPSDKYLRKALSPALLGVIKANEDYKETSAERFFEIAHVYFAGSGENMFSEKTVLAICAKSGDIFELKGVMREIFDKAGIAGVSYKFGRHSCLSFDETMVVTLADGRPAGVIGKITKQAADRLELRCMPAICEIDMELLYENAGLARTYRKFSRFPAVKRDLAFVIDKAVQWSEIEAAVRAGNPANLEELSFFDAFEGGKIPQGKKNLAFSLQFRANDRTLSAEEVEREMQKLVSLITGKFGAVLRTF